MVIFCVVVRSAWDRRTEPREVPSGMKVLADSHFLCTCFSTLRPLYNQTSETPRASALRFCTPNLRKIESALGLELYEGEDEDMDASKEGGLMSESRESLREACTVIVEDAINAVLLGLRERVCTGSFTGCSPNSCDALLFSSVSLPP